MCITSTSVEHLNYYIGIYWDSSVKICLSITSPYSVQTPFMKIQCHPATVKLGLLPIFSNHLVYVALHSWVLTSYKDAIDLTKFCYFSITKNSCKSCLPFSFKRGSEWLLCNANATQQFFSYFLARTS
jgi:hypothetical protein